MTKVFVQLGLVILIAVGGFFGLQKFKAMKKAPKKRPSVQYIPLVTVSEAKIFDEQIVVKGFGSVKPKVQIELVPQVSGKVKEISSSLVNGGFVKANDVLVAIEKNDFEHQVDQAKSVVVQAQAAIKQAEALVLQGEVKLQQEQAEALVAKEEWQQLNPGKDMKEANPLALRIPQIKSAQASLLSAQGQFQAANGQLSSAKAKLAIAELNLERTDLSVPFDGRVVSENVDPGQMIGMSKAIATIYSTEKMEIVVPLEDRELRWFDVPGINNSNGSDVDVFADYQGQERCWDGKVIRSEGSVDGGSRMVNVVIEVDKPFECRDGKATLVPGMFVRIEIKGRKADGLVRLLDRCLHNGNEVWIVENNKLHIKIFKQGEIVRRDKDYIYVSNAIKANQIIVSSQLDAVTEGMIVLMEGQNRKEVLTKMKPLSTKKSGAKQ